MFTSKKAYRIIHCQTKHESDKRNLGIALFSFLIQVTLAGYVVLELWDIFSKPEKREDVKIFRFLPLASITAIYSIILALPGLAEVKETYNIYGRIGPLQMIDVIINAILPSVILFSGFFVILAQDSYIEAVLNSAALLFIPEIDDQLPPLLGFRESVIVKNYLIAESMQEFDEICKIPDLKLTREKLKARHGSIGVQFADYYLTNSIEEGSAPMKGVLFQPFQIKKGYHGSGHQKVQRF